jgi:hypothetical protein
MDVSVEFASPHQLMPHRPKIWHTEDQILAAIGRTRRLAEKHLKRSQTLNELAKEKFGHCEKLRFQLMGATSMTDYQREYLESKVRSAEIAAGKAKDKADQVAASYHRAINSTLPRLGEILSAFRTQPMVGIMGDYKGVAVK